MIPEKGVGMSYIKVILFASIGLTIAEKSNDYQLPDNVYPIHYEVKLIVNTTTFHPTHIGEVHINIHILSATSVLILNAKNLRLSHYIQPWLFTDQGITIFIQMINVENNLELHFKAPVPPGKYTLYIGFESNSIHNFYQSLFHGETKLFEKDNRLILTQFGKLATRQLFPCWDDPTFKATFNITIKHSEKYTALSNMPPLRHYKDNDSMICSKFDITPMMSTHQLVIVLLPFSVEHNLQFLTVHTWCRSDTTLTIPFAYSVARKTPNHLLQYTNISSGILKTDHVVIWDVPYSEAHWGLIIHRESDVIYNKKKDPISVKIQVANTVASQVARQWFGGLVTPNSWTHSWLSESFVLLLSRYALDQIHEEWHEMFFMVVENLHDLMHEDNDSMPPVLFEINSNIDILLLKTTLNVYHKGSVLLRMLQHIMGEKIFQKGVIKFVDKYKYGLVTTDNLWSAMQDAFDATKSESKVDIKKVMDTWITQKGFPLVIVTRDYVTGKIIISQQSYYAFDSSEIIYRSSKWWIPVTWTTQSSSNFQETTPTLWLGPETDPITITIDPDEWIIVNLQQTGYYRVNYDRTNWEKIGNYLKNEDYSNIHVLNRAQIIDDICNIFAKGHVDWILFLHVTKYLSREINYIPWISMLKCMDMLMEFFSLPESKMFQMPLANYFNNILNQIGFEEDLENDDDHTRRVQLNLALHACTLGNPTCTTAAGDKLEKYLAEPTKHSILPWWEHWTFCFGLKTTNVKTWHKVLRLYKETKNKIILNSLLCTEHIVAIIEFLYIIVKDDKLIEKADLPDFIANVIKQHIHNNQIFSYILNELVLLKSISANYIFDNIIKNLYCEEKLDELSLFIKIFTNDFLYENKIEQRRQEIRILKKNFNDTFGNKIQ